MEEDELRKWRRIQSERDAHVPRTTEERLLHPANEGNDVARAHDWARPAQAPAPERRAAPPHVAGSTEKRVGGGEPKKHPRPPQMERPRTVFARPGVAPMHNGPPKHVAPGRPRTDEAEEVEETEIEAEADADAETEEK